MSLIPIKFPPNPSDGMIFEILPGVYYQYEKGTNCWIKLDGYDTIGPATPVQDGIMESVDYKKLIGLIVPPPIIALKPEDCEVWLDTGTIDFRTADDFVTIEGSVNLTHGGQILNEPWHIVGNVWGIDFGIDLAELLKEVENRGNLTRRMRPGETGDQGDKGISGSDNLDTGPVGDVGADGTNAPFGGIVTDEPTSLETVGEKNVAIVDVTTEENNKEGRIVITRANVGNPLACPSEIIPKPPKSPWALILNDNPSKAIFTKERAVNTDCAVSCHICVNLHYLYIDPILQAIYNRFVELVLALKKQKEDVVKSWLTTMLTVYNKQKAALCCAIENYTSRQRNANARQRIEDQRISAAMGDFSLIVDGAGDREQMDMDPEKTCKGGSQAKTGGTDCKTCQLEMTIDGKVNGSPQTAVTGELPAGAYVAEITTCCINKAGNTGKWTGKAALGYVTSHDCQVDNFDPFKPLGDSSRHVTVYFPDFGDFSTNNQAESVYKNQTLSFNHNGGEIKAWLDDTYLQDNSGNIVICIRPASCYRAPQGPINLTSGHTLEDIINVFDTDTSPNNLIGAGLPFLGSMNTVQNYSYGEKHTGSACDPTDVDCDEYGPNLTFGPPLMRNELRFFFYDGSDGLSLCFVINKKNLSDIQHTIKMQMSVDENSAPVNIMVSDEPGEFGGGPDNFVGEFAYPGTLGVVHGDGGVIGYLDKTNAHWNVRVKFLDLGNLQRVRFMSSEGTVTTIAATSYTDNELPDLPPGAPGISTALKDRTFIFSPTGPGCYMPATQLDWYIRGLRIGACCAAVIDVSGTTWAVIKRSIGPDGTCGGGESLGSECISRFIDGRGHPSIAWPVTLPSLEGIGMPTSGEVHFVEDAELESTFMSKIQAGQVIMSIGDLSEHTFILFPKMF
jgi:hypothetical protein